MNFITIRYNCAVALPVFSCLIFYTMLFVWSLQKAGLIEGNFLKITCYRIVHLSTCYIGLRFYIPRLREKHDKPLPPSQQYNRAIYEFK